MKKLLLIGLLLSGICLSVNISTYAASAYLDLNRFNYQNNLEEQDSFLGVVGIDYPADTFKVNLEYQRGLIFSQPSVLITASDYKGEYAIINTTRYKMYVTISLYKLKFEEFFEEIDATLFGFDLQGFLTPNAYLEFALSYTDSAKNISMSGIEVTNYKLKFSVFPTGRLGLSTGFRYNQVKYPDDSQIKLNGYLVGLIHKF